MILVTGKKQNQIDNSVSLSRFGLDYDCFFVKNNNLSNILLPKKDRKKKGFNGD